MLYEKHLGFDLSTTALAVGVRSGDGREGFFSVPMRGAVKWKGKPAFDLAFLPGMIEEALLGLIDDGWDLGGAGALSFSVRQHDMVLLDSWGVPLLPALSWQCNAAERQTKWINSKREIYEMVGKVEERFILPKLLWALDQDPGLMERVAKVMTTGDYIAYMLTNSDFISSSDGLSNGLVHRRSKSIAVEAIKECGLSPDIFPQVIESGTGIDPVSTNHVHAIGDWRKVASMLDGWLVISSLGDNHAGAVGCGLCSDRMMVVSAGTSGTVVRIAHEGDARLGETAVFEYYDEELLLSMLPHCASWYEQFAKERHPGKDLRQIDREMELHIEGWTRHPLSRIPVGAITDGKGQDSAVDTANVQASIALELLLLVKKMLDEVTEPDSGIDAVVLTGGLSRSPFFQEVMRVGVGMLIPGVELRISAHEGPLAHKAAALGAVINAIIGSDGGEISKRIAELCPTAPVPARFYMPTVIESFLKENL